MYSWILGEWKNVVLSQGISWYFTRTEYGSGWAYRKQHELLGVYVNEKMKGEKKRRRRRNRTRQANLAIGQFNKSHAQQGDLVRRGLGTMSVLSTSSLCCYIWRVQLIRAQGQALNPGGTLCDVTQATETIRRMSSTASGDPHDRVVGEVTTSGSDLILPALCLSGGQGPPHL